MKYWSGGPDWYTRKQCWSVRPRGAAGCGASELRDAAACPFPSRVPLVMDSAAVLAKSMVTCVQGSGLSGMFTEPRVTPGTVPLTRKFPNTQYLRPPWLGPELRDRFWVLAWLMESRCSSEVSVSEVPE